MSDTEKQEFIVCLSPGHCEVMAVSYGYEGLRIRDNYKLDVLSRYKDAKYGDIVQVWNNCLWGSIMASNTKEALDIFYERVNEKRTGK